ncbi:MAG TPA: ankyrin repeat domain-containing protein [Rickettsia endosymbiont of Pyrocoelia pectoralis]|nr:ankyrin repeat domain-containing protein [Rickettsia endosymbiont of Pyrocoelia pectoralis]
MYISYGEKHRKHKKSSDLILKADNTNQNTSQINVPENLKINEEFREKCYKVLTKDILARKNIILSAFLAKDLEALKLFIEILKTDITVDDIFGTNLIEGDRKDILQYFIEDLKLDFTNLKNSQGESLLSFAAMYGSRKCVTYLLDKGYNPNNQNLKGITTLQRAIMGNHPEIAEALIQKEARFDNNTLKCLAESKYSVSDAKKLINILAQDQSIDKQVVEKNYNTLRKPLLRELKIVKTEKSLSEFQEMDMKLKTNYCKAIIGQKYEIFPELILEVKEALRYQFNELKQSKSQNKESTLANIKDLLYNVIDVYKIFKFSGSEELRKDITNYLEKYDNPKFKVSFYKYLLLELYKNSNFLEAIKYGHAALKILDSQETKSDITDKQNILYNLGRSYTQINTEVALKYLNQAETLAPNNEYIIVEKYYIYLSRNQIIQAELEVEKIKDLELKNLLLIRLFLVTGQSPESFNFEENKFNGDELKTSVYNDTLSILYNKTRDTQNLINLYEKQITDGINQNYPEKAYNITCKALILFKDARKWNEGLSFLDQIYNKYPTIFQNHNSSTLKYYEFLFYNDSSTHSSEAEKILNSLNNKIFFTKEGFKIIAYIYELAIYSALLNNDSVKIALYQNNLNKFPNNREIESVKKLAQIFSYIISETKEADALDTSLPTSNAEILDSQAPKSELPESTKISQIIKAKNTSFAEIEMMIADQDHESILKLN